MCQRPCKKSPTGFCEKSKPFCSCYGLALEPSEKCEIHGYGPVRIYCKYCSKFMKRKTNENSCNQ